MKPIRLIVNADDYGRTKGVSAGIRHAHLHGIVTSTTAMMNMPDVEAALRQALAECPRLGLGVHLVLTSGKPLLPAEKVHSLLKDGTHFPGLEDFVERLPAVNPGEVVAEWRAQIERFVSITGRKPDHLDSHHHSSYFTPRFFEMMLELAQENGCPIRLPFSEGEAALGDLPPDSARQALQASAALLAKYPARHPERFISTFYYESATKADLQAILRDLRQNEQREPAELMTHPGFLDEALASGMPDVAASSYSQQRPIEVAALTDKSTLDLVNELNIQLISFGVLS